MQIHNSPHIKDQTPFAVLAPSPAAKAALSTVDQRKADAHREIADRYASKRRNRPRPSIVSLTIRNLQTFYSDKYGVSFPDDDAGRDDLVVLLRYLSQLGDPRAMRACAAHRCPWLADAEYTAMIVEIERKPPRWRADALAQEIGLNHATRTRLGITTIGAIDFRKAKRTKRHKKLNNADKRARRAEAGATSHAVSAERTKPWEALKISRRTYYRRKANGTFGTDSGTAASTTIVYPNQCHANQGSGPSRVSGDVLGRSDSHGVMNTELSAAADLSQSQAAADLSQSQALAADIAAASKSKTVMHVVKRDSAFAGRLSLQLVETRSDTSFNLCRLRVFESGMGRVAA